MKGIFPQYSIFSDRMRSAIWKEAVFIFDTNVLLNLYRYEKSTRDLLFEILEQNSGRIWIPYHVALEFQRNRLKVIADQNKRFSDVRKVVDKVRNDMSNSFDSFQLKTRHSSINPQKLTDGFNKLANDFFRHLDDLQKSQQQVNGVDPLKVRVEALFHHRVGNPPSDQHVLDCWSKEAEDRYSRKVPPGYLDSGKDKEEGNEFLHNNLRYKTQYGDYYVWAQILDYVRKNGVKSVIYVTDDNKEDWWQKVESEG